MIFSMDIIGRRACSLFCLMYVPEFIFRDSAEWFKAVKCWIHLLKDVTSHHLTFSRKPRQQLNIQYVGNFLLRQEVYTD